MRMNELIHAITLLATLGESQALPKPISNENSVIDLELEELSEEIPSISIDDSVAGPSTEHSVKEKSNKQNEDEVPGVS